MPEHNGSGVATLNSVSLTDRTTQYSVSLADYDKDRLEDVGFLTAMTLVLLGNYAQTGHFGGPWLTRPTPLPPIWWGLNWAV